MLSFLSGFVFHPELLQLKNEGVVKAQFCSSALAHRVVARAGWRTKTLEISP
jgi:hypothetical protein